MDVRLDWETVQAAHQTLVNYCRFADEGRADEFAALYTEDAILEAGPKPVQGREIIRHGLLRLLARYQATSHHLSNVSMERVDGATISAYSYVYAWHRRRSTGEPVEFWGRYTDILKLRQGQWLIAHRKVEMVDMRGMDNPGFPIAPRHSPPA